MHVGVAHFQSVWTIIGYIQISAHSRKAVRPRPFRNSQFMLSNTNELSSQSRMIPVDTLRDCMIGHVVGCLNVLTIDWAVCECPLLFTAVVPCSESRMFRVVLSVFSSVLPFKMLIWRLEICSDQFCSLSQWLFIVIILLTFTTEGHSGLSRRVAFPHKSAQFLPRTLNYL